MVRLLEGDSSISARMARRSSVAETTGKRTTSMHPKASRHCREVERAAGVGRSGRPPQPIGRQRQKQPREIEQQFHRNEARREKTPRVGSFSEISNASQCDYRVAGVGRRRKTEPAEHSYTEAGEVWESMEIGFWPVVGVIRTVKGGAMAKDQKVWRALELGLLLVCVVAMSACQLKLASVGDEQDGAPGAPAQQSGAGVSHRK